MTSNQNTLFHPISSAIAALDTSPISEDRKRTLDKLVDYITLKRKSSEVVRLNFICSHNSRRSHLAQVWAQTMAYNFGIAPVACFSAGTEATAMYPLIGSTLQETGFEVGKLSTSDNPVYMVKFAKNENPIIVFSKALDHPFNPHNEFAAVMVCSEADQACPNIIGADARFAIAYEDPKEYDHTPFQNEKYLERSLQIAGEFYYIFSEVRRKLNISKA